MTVHQLSELTREEVRRLAPGSVALWPIGSLEQHAEHLPLGTDTMLVDAVVNAALGDPAQLPSSVSLIRVPTLPFGFSGHHQFAAAVSLPPAVLGSVIESTLDSLWQMGFRRALIVNGHGGNQEMMSQSAKLHALGHDGVVGFCSYWELTDAAEEHERPDSTPGHAGWFETSLMLAAHPDLVRAEAIDDGPSDPPLFDNPPRPGLHLERHGEWGRVGGSTDSAREADVAAGAALLRSRVAGVLGAVVAVAGIPIDPDGATTATRSPGPSTDQQHPTPIQEAP